MGLLSSSSSKTYLTETNIDNSQPNPAGQNIVGGGGSVGASDFGKSVNFSAEGKGNQLESWEVSDGLVINRSNGTFNFDIFMQQDKEPEAITEKVLSQYISGATTEQLEQTKAIVSTTTIKSAAVLIGAFFLWQVLRKK